MKISFKRAFDRLDEFQGINESTVCEELEIDYGKISGDVLSRVKSENRGLRRHRKMIAVSLIAAVLAVGVIGTTVIGANLGFGEAFSEQFSGDTDIVNLYDGGNVQFSSDSLNIHFLGVTGDQKHLYAAFELTKKDGSTFTDEGFDSLSADMFTLAPGEEKLYLKLPEYDMSVYLVDKDGQYFSDKVGGSSGEASYYLDESRKTLKVCINYEDTNMQNGKMFLNSKTFEATKIVGKLADYQCDWQEAVSNAKKLCEEKDLSYNGDCILKRTGSYHYELLQKETKQLELPFDLNFDMNFKSENKIVDINDSQAELLFNGYAKNCTMNITPLGLYINADVGEDAPNSYLDNLFYDENAKIYLDDGTEYYISLYGLEGRTIKDEPDIADKSSQYLEFWFSKQYPESPEESEPRNVINPEKVSKIVLDGYTVYEK